jgi:hypothetical protein
MGRPERRSVQSGIIRPEDQAFALMMQELSGQFSAATENLLVLLMCGVGSCSGRDRSEVYTSQAKFNALSTL